jgi:hypothetical protein
MLWSVSQMYAGFVILDVVAGRRYIDRLYATREEAQRELDSLLKPYPDGHEWRRRLEVAEAYAQ